MLYGTAAATHTTAEAKDAGEEEEDAGLADPTISSDKERGASI